MNSGEQLISQKREAVNRTFEKLLDFSFSDDFLLLRDSNKFEEYRMKREVATGALNNLKQHYPSGIQRSQIDKVSSLLQEKETLLLGVMNAISDFSRTDSLLQRRIPVIASQAQIRILCVHFFLQGIEFSGCPAGGGRLCLFLPLTGIGGFFFFLFEQSRKRNRGDSRIKAAVFLHYPFDSRCRHPADCGVLSV